MIFPSVFILIFVEWFLYATFQTEEVDGRGRDLLRRRSGFLYFPTGRAIQFQRLILLYAHILPVCKCILIHR